MVIVHNCSRTCVSILGNGDKFWEVIPRFHETVVP